MDRNVFFVDVSEIPPDQLDRYLELVRAQIEGTVPEWGENTTLDSFEVPVPDKRGGWWTRFKGWVVGSHKKR